MLIHHGGKEYQLAAGEAAEHARNKLQAIIDSGKQNAKIALVSIMNEYAIRKDLIADKEAIDYGITDDGKVDILIGDKALKTTNYSYSQLLNRLGLPKTYADRLTDRKELWAAGLLYNNLTTLTKQGLEDRLLLRTVNGVAKGVLSSSYRRMDASPIYEAFIQEGLKHGFVPVAGLNTDTRYHIKMLYEELFEPAPNEVVAFGFSLTTSDYGAGALTLQFLVMRLWCTNYAIGQNCLRKVHLGKRFDGGDMFSQDTYDLDTKTIASAVRDVMSDGSNGLRGRMYNTCKLIANANEKQLDVTKELEAMRHRNILTKPEANEAEVLYNSSVGVVELPQNKGAWRFSNVLSLMANNTEGDHQLDLQEAAMKVLAA